MQCVGEPVLDLTSPLLPVRRVAQPARAMRHVGPGADVGDPGHQRVDVAVEPLQLRDHAADPVVGQHALRPGQVPVDRGEQMEVGVGKSLAEVGNLADLPEQADPLLVGGDRADLVAPREEDEAAMVDGVAHPEQAVQTRLSVETGAQRLDVGEVELAVAPADRLERRKAVALDRLDLARLERLRAVGGAEGAVRHVPAGAAGDLGHLGRPQAAMLGAVELGQAGERDMGDVHVETHADRVGGDQMLDLARLVHGDLGVAGTRRQSAEHHGRTALLAADDLGERVDLRGRERDHGAAARQAVQLAVAREGQDREARPADHLRLGHQPLEERPDRVGAEEHRLLGSAGVQHAVGEDVAALVVGGELDLVDGEERHRPADGHRLDGADEIGGILRPDLLLAGDQGARGAALDGDDAVVDLAGEQAEGEAHHPGAMGEHAFDGEVSSCPCWSAPRPPPPDPDTQGVEPCPGRSRLQPGLARGIAA